MRTYHWFCLFGILFLVSGFNTASVACFIASLYFSFTADEEYHA